MKNAKTRIISLLLCLILSLALLPATALAAGGVKINAVNFPDNSFRYYVSCTFDKNHDGKLSAEECAAVESIYVQSCCITSLKGIENFPALKFLDCGYNKLKKLNVTKNTALQTLYCGGNQLTTLNVTKNTELQTLFCESNKLTNLDLTQNTVINEVRCGCNSIASLDIRNNPRLIHAYRKGDRFAYGNGGSYYQFTQYGGGTTVLFGLGVDQKTKVQAGTAKPPVLSAQPVSKCVGADRSVSFTVSATGEGLTYQWYVIKKASDGPIKLAGKTDAKLTITAKKSMAGYKFFCVVTGKGGVLYSKTATLGIIVPPVINGQPRSASARAGERVTFKVKATGTNLKYQWYYQKPGKSTWLIVSKGTTAALSLTAKTEKDGYKFRCLVKNGGGAVYTKSVRLTVK